MIFNYRILYLVLSILIVFGVTYFFKKKLNIIILNFDENHRSLRLFLAVVSFLIFFVMTINVFVVNVLFLSYDVIYIASSYMEYCLYWAMSYVFLMCCFTKSSFYDYKSYALKQLYVVLPLMTILMFILQFGLFFLFGAKLHW